MKLVKYYSLVIGIIALTNLIFYFSNFNSTDSVQGIASKENWQEMLIGSWDFTIGIESANQLDFYEGVVEYRSDGTFKRYVTALFIFDHMPYTEHIDEPFPFRQSDLVVSGTVEGKWMIGEGQYWEEIIETCDMVPTHCSDDCQSIYKIRYNTLPDISCVGFSEESTLTYGLDDGIENQKLQIFSEDKIVIEARTNRNHTKLYSYEKKKS